MKTPLPYFWSFCWLHTGFICAVGFLCVKGLYAECAAEAGGSFLLHPLLRPAAALFVAGAVMAAGRPEAQDHHHHHHPPENGFTPLEHPAVPRLLPRIDGSVLPSLGGFGKHQKQLVVLTWIPALFIGFSQFSDYFLLAQPNGTCVQPLANESNWTAAAPPVPQHPGLQLRGNGTGEGYGDGGGLLCACKEWRLELQTGLSQNVVTKVTR